LNLRNSSKTTCSFSLGSIMGFMVVIPALMRRNCVWRRFRVVHLLPDVFARPCLPNFVVEPPDVEDTPMELVRVRGDVVVVEVEDKRDVEFAYR
jgi:hypothetical protein